MRGDGFPVELVGGVPVVTAPEEIDITNAAGLRAACLKRLGLKRLGSRRPGIRRSWST